MFKILCENFIKNFQKIFHINNDYKILFNYSKLQEFQNWYNNDNDIKQMIIFSSGIDISNFIFMKSNLENICAFENKKTMWKIFLICLNTCKKINESCGIYINQKYYHVGIENFEFDSSSVF